MGEPHRPTPPADPAALRANLLAAARLQAGQTIELLRAAVDMAAGTPDTTPDPAGATVRARLAGNAMAAAADAFTRYADASAAPPLHVAVVFRRLPGSANPYVYQVFGPEADAEAAAAAVTAPADPHVWERVEVHEMRPRRAGGPR